MFSERFGKSIVITDHARGRMAARAISEALLRDLTGPRSDRTLRFESAPPPNHATIPADRRDAWSPPPAGPEPYLRVSPKPAAEQWTREASHEDRLEEALYRQEFRNIRTAYDGSQRLTIREPLNPHRV